MNSHGAKILHLKSKATDETVHSQGRVMADRSVLFKYINPIFKNVITISNKRKTKQERAKMIKLVSSMVESFSDTNGSKYKMAKNC